MELEIVYVPSAFKHHYTDVDIRHAIFNAVYDDITDDDPEKHLLIGFDRNTNPLEILYNIIDERTINVFHADKCTKEHRALLNL
jgi:hypothetical protein